MDKLDPILNQASSLWMRHQVEIICAGFLLVMALMVFYAIKTMLVLLWRRRRRRTMTLNDWFSIAAASLSQTIVDRMGGSMALEDPSVRVFTVAQIKSMFGDVIHDLIKQAVNKKYLTKNESKRFLEFASFRLGDLELMPPKEEVPPPPASVVKEAIRRRRKNGGPAPKLPEPETVETVKVTKGDSLASLLQNKLKPQPT